MSTREGLSTVQEPNRSEAYEGDASQTAVIAAQATRQRTERRFEIGLFIRKRVRRVLAYYRQLALSRAKRDIVPVQQKLMAPLPPPPSEADSTLDGPGVSTQGVMGEDDGGPIEGTTSYEVGGFMSVTTETTTDGT